MIRRSKVHFKGLDFSGPCKVLPPTFGGIRQLVERVGEEAARLQFAVSAPDVDDAPHDLVREFLVELRTADKVERQTLINEFGDYIDSLKESVSSSSRAEAAPAAPGGRAEPPAGEAEAQQAGEQSDPA